MPKKPVMLLYHPGGFVFGDPSSMTAAKRRARKAGFAARAVDYGSGRMPLGRQTKRAFKEAKRTLVDDFERDYLARLLARAGTNVSRAASLAGIERQTLRDLLKKHGLRGDEG